MRAGNRVELLLQGVGLFADRRERRLGGVADRIAQKLGLARDAFHGVGGGAGELLVERLGVAGEGGERLVGREMEAFTQAFGVAGDAFDRLHAEAGVGLADGLGVGAEIGDRAIRRFGDMRLQRLRLRAHVLHGGLGGQGEVFRGAGAMRRQGFREGVAGGAQHVLRLVGFLMQPKRQVLAERGEGLMQRGAVHGDDLMQAAGLAFEPRAQFVAAATQRVADLLADFAQMLRQRRRMRVDLLDEGAGERAQFAVDLRRALVDRARNLDARAMEALEQAFRATLELPHEVFAGFGEGRVDAGGLVLERDGDAPAALVEQVGQLSCRRFEFDGDRILRIVQRRRNTVGIDDDGFALARQFVEQDADAAFIVAIGALERRHFAPHHGFEFAGAGQGALDAVAHRGDLAANGLAQGDNLLGGDGFRLGEADRHFGHGAGGQAHFLRASRHRAHGNQENDRAGQGKDRNRGHGAEQRAGKGRPVAEDEIADPQAGPCGRNDDRRRHRAGIGTGLQALEDLADRRTVVIGRASSRREAPARGLAVARRSQFVRAYFGQLRREFGRFRAGGRQMEIELPAFFRRLLGRRVGLDMQLERILDGRQSGGRGILSLARCGHVLSPL